MKKKVALIGTAGRNANGHSTLLDSFVYQCMLQKASHIIENDFKLRWEDIVLVSGGAAWADHTAVDLATQHNVDLILHFPCEWDAEKKQFLDTGNSDWKVNPGRSANRYHSQFSSKTKRTTLVELDDILGRANTTKVIGKGFHDRNLQIAKSDYLIAFTWSTGDQPTDGGTKFTWDKSSKETIKTHVSLSTLSEDPSTSDVGPLKRKSHSTNSPSKKQKTHEVEATINK